MNSNKEGLNTGWREQVGSQSRKKYHKTSNCEVSVVLHFKVNLSNCWNKEIGNSQLR